MRTEDAEEFTAALGLVIGGAVRLADWAPTVDIPAALGLSTDEWAQRRLMGRVTLSIDERRRIVQANPEKSTRELGEALGVTHQTIANDRGSVKDLTLERTSESLGQDGTGPAVKDLTPEPPHVTHNSGNDEWYTPPEYVEAARDVLGSIDLDPASSDVANETVRARHYYTAARDGLAQPWAGRVWLNPPYSTGLVDKFVTRLLASDDVEAAVVLTNNATDTRWWQALARRSTGVCMLAGRIRFRGPDGAVAGAGLQGQTITYLGDERDRFLARFEEFGVVL